MENNESTLTSALVLASRNRKKIKELEALLGGLNVRLLSLDDIGFTGEIEEMGDSFEENSRLKAEVPAKLGYIGVADDSGLCVDALSENGREVPGIYSARYAGDHGDAANNKKLLSELRDVPDGERGAKFVCVISCVFPDGRSFSARGECAGEILRAPRGEGGFGYDPLFYSPELGKAFAEAYDTEKNSVSHRGRATEKFVHLLSEALGRSEHGEL